jgi:ABC-2 type transport system ATP-binding protein
MSSTPADNVLECRGLRKYFPDVKAVDGIDLTIRRGECFGLLGPNGAGKTTTIEIFEGLTEPDAGEVLLLGQHWSRNPRSLRERIGISLQETRFSEKLTVEETITLFRSFYRDGRDPEETMRQLSLQEKRDARVGKLSGGQKQRLAVACALVGNPDVLFLDEPTTGLDPQSRLELWEQVTAFRAAGGTILLTTHYMEEAERLCDRIAIVDHGKIIAEGTPAELISTMHAANVVEFASEPMIGDDVVRSIEGVQSIIHRGPNLSLAVNSLVGVVPRLLETIDSAGAKLVHLTTHRATLEDVFVSLTGRELRDE